MARLEDWRPGSWERESSDAEQRKARRLFAEILRGGRERAPRDPTEADYTRWCREQIQRIDNDPLVLRYANYLEFASGRIGRNHEWWHAFGQQMLTARAFARGVTWEEVMEDKVAYALADNPPIFDERILRRATGEQNRFGPRQIAWDFSQFCVDAMTYLWHENTRDAALWAPLVPHVIQPNAFPFDEMFFAFEHDAWTFNQDYQVLGSDDKAPVENITSFVLTVKLGDVGALLVWDQMLYPEGDYAPQVHFVFQPLFWDKRWPEDFEGSPYFDEIGNILRMLAFSQAPFLEPTAPQRLPRLIRRDYERAGRKPPEIKQVSVITLRARPNEPIFRNGTSDNGTTREYQHSWWVRGHYRWQYYPSENTHKMIAIDQYMKQVGKPILKQLRDVSR